MAKDRKERAVSPSEMGMSLEEMLRRGARQLIQQAIEAELAELMGEYDNVRVLDGRKAVVKNGYLPQREILTAAGPVAGPGGSGRVRRRVRWRCRCPRSGTGRAAA